VGKFTKSDDWEAVTAEEAGVPTEHHVGYQRDGSSMRAVLMKKDGVVQGIVTRFDVLEYLMHR
jgi:hypothetical protein